MPLVLMLGLGAVYLMYRRSTRPKCPRSIVALGDSITAGNYIKHVGKALPGCTVGFFGYVGEGTRVINEKADRALASKPDDVLVLAGVNDLASGRSLNSTQDNLERIYSKVHSSGGRVVAIEILPWFSYRGSRGFEEKTKRLNEWIRSESSADVVVDASDLGNDDFEMLEDFSGDGLHPNSNGKKRLAEIIVKQVY